MVRFPAPEGWFLCCWKKKFIVLPLVIFLASLVFLIFIPRSTFAQSPTPTIPPLPATNTATWEFDPIVTEVGKNADRARQLLWWVFQHPGIHTAPVIAQIWAIARNIVYVFIVLVIVAFGISLILGKRKGALGPVFSGITSPVFGVNIPVIFIKIAAYLLFVTFSYIALVALIQTSDIIMRFFIETVGGKDLFNIIFSGAGNTEANYITFVGYRDINPLSLEMVNTSLLYVKLTSFTYNVMSAVLVFRTIILWFLLIISPFLALLLPFVFIRNAGWIWIGVFFQWLFYGPIFALFLASLTRIWVAGIPYSFDFSRVNKPSGQVYRTAINILWGGPAQTLSPGNSANYVDTYAEYFIALVMLWTAILLPWLLLRIFRDYCCEMIASSANTLSSIFDRLRQYPPPPPSAPVSPVSTSGIAVELPFRQRIEEKIKDIQRVRIEEIKDVSNVSTIDIVKALDMKATKLSDISRYETNMMRKSEVSSNLNKISAPEKIATPQEREKFMMVREELVQRAMKGDKVAQTLLAASDRQTRVMTSQVISQSKTVAAQMKAAATPQIKIEASIPAITNKSVVEQVSSKVGTSEIRTRDVISRITISELSDRKKVEEVSKQTGVPVEKVNSIVTQANSEWKSTFKEYSESVDQAAKSSQVSEIKAREILSKITASEITNTEKVKAVSAETGVSQEKVKEIVTSFEKNRSVNREIGDNVEQVSREIQVSEVKAREVLSKITATEITNTEKVKAVSAETGVSEEKVKEVVSSFEKNKKAKLSTEQKQFIEKVSTRTNVSSQSAKEIISSITESELTDKVKVNELAKKLGVTEDSVRNVVKEATKVKQEKVEAIDEDVIANITKSSSLSASTVRKVLSSISASELDNAEIVEKVEKVTGVTGENIKKIVEQSVTEMQAKEVIPSAAVSVEDYEEVKTMWLKHYRSSPVPVSENIKTRIDWLGAEEKKLTNIMNLLSSANPQLKQEGLEKVSEILPFMLLGGFSDAEIMTYIKAKLEADRQVLGEVELEEKAVEKAKEELKEEEELIAVGEKKEEEKEKAEVISQSREIPQDEEADKKPAGKGDQQRKTAGGISQPKDDV